MLSVKFFMLMLSILKAIIFMLSVIMLSDKFFFIFMLSVVMLTVVRLSFILLIIR
jgi:hypothetical protein